ncbi:MAG: type II toxin-antitoxin system Phd/YefM family antitoxin [Candidatus Binatia bacterium]
MRAVAVKELKNKLSAYLREVAAGEVVLVTDRGRVVAELRQPTTGLPLDPQELALEKLIAEGLLTRALPRDPDSHRQTGVKLQEGSSQELLDAERAER